MRIKMIMITLLAGFLGLNANAGFEQFNPVNGAINVFDLGGGYISTITPYGLGDVRSITTNNLAFKLQPNINLYGDGSDPYWANGEFGAKILEGLTLWEMAPGTDHELTADINYVQFNFNVDAYSLNPAYSVVAFVKVLDPASGYSESIIQSAPIDRLGAFQLSISPTPVMAGQLLQAGWYLRGPNVSPANSNTYGSATITVSGLFANSSDIVAPAPNPMTFAIAPNAISDSEINMTASIAIDNIYDVEYLFTNTTAGTSSGWQSGRSYSEAGLNNSTTYAYKVKARDTGVNANETAWSIVASATTGAEDTTKPQPATMSFASTDVGTSMIKLTAVTATDAAGVQYYFDYTGSDTNVVDSGWQNSPVYYATGLVPGSTYSYTVIARDNAAAHNSNTVSAVENLTTLTTEPGAFANALTGFTGNTDDPDVLLELNKIGLETGSINESAIINFGATGATFGAGLTSTARDVLRTVSTGYGDVSFEAYATLTFSGASDLSGFIGMGQGLQIGVAPNYGVPELNLGGVNGVCAQFKDTTAGSHVYKCNLFKFVGGNPTTAAGGAELLSNPVGSTETIRARLIYDAVAETVNVSFDKNYTGGAFVADQDMGTVSTALADTTSMWLGAPVRVYAGGGEGTIVKDFKIVVTYVIPTPFVVQIANIAAGETAFAWEGAFGNTYDVQYSTNLVAGPWMIDPSPGASDIFSTGGAMSATSTVDNVSVFYRVIVQ